MANDVWACCEKANSRGRTVTVKINGPTFSCLFVADRWNRRSKQGPGCMKSPST